MTQHLWGDDWPHWNDLGSAVRELSDFARRWGRLGIHTKEKWGCLRASTYWSTNLHSLIWPGYVYAQWDRHLPKWLASRLWWLDVYAWPRIFRWTPIRWYQQKIYGLAYRRLVVRYPHLVDEIYHDCEYPELVNWEAQGVHGAYWRHCRLVTDTEDADIPHIDGDSI